MTAESGSKIRLNLKPETPQPAKWRKAVCPNCGYRRADKDPDGVVWCPACGYSKKGCYT